MAPLTPAVLFCILSLGLAGRPPVPGSEVGAASDPGPERESHRHRPDYASVIESLKHEVPRLLAENQVPGASLVLVDDQAVVWAWGFGSTDRSGKRRITADTRFSLQSISKTYTATAFLIAADRGRFALDETLRGMAWGSTAGLITGPRSCSTGAAVTATRPASAGSRSTRSASSS